MIHKEGYGIILVTLLSFILFGFLLHRFLYVFSPLFFFLFLMAMTGLTVFVIQFFRNPSRTTPHHPAYIIAPADGKVVIIQETFENEYFKERRLQVSIFMSPLDVHVNRSPVSGQVKYYKYHPGKYLVAWHPKSSSLNERNTIIIENTKGVKVLVRQIAGTVARRIRCYLQEGQEVTQGQEIGFIKFGSRCDLFLPPGTKVKVRLNEQVYAGESLLAELD